MRGRGASVLGNALVVATLVTAAIGWLVAEDGWQRPDVGTARWVAVALVLCGYAALCLHAVARSRWAGQVAPIVGDDLVLVVFATQTGFAEELATQTAKAVAGAGHHVVTVPLARLDPQSLVAARVAFFIVATYGDGEPPDAVRRFVRQSMQTPLPLGDLQYGVLALGDRAYVRYCGFGADVDRWLISGGATPAFERIDVDNGAPTALAAWQSRLKPWTGGVAAGDLAVPAFDAWRLVDRRLSNRGSFGGPVFHVALAPRHGACPSWQAGDIAIVRLPDGEQREYSIASLPSDGRVDLLVRQAVRPDGEPGRGARWLTSTLAEGEETALRIRANHGFRLEDVAASTPLILIGNGTGIAGLRAHLKARAAQGARRNWLLFGERNEAIDNHYADDLDAWRRDRTLERVSFAYSRDGVRRHHVQDRLLAERDTVVAWAADAAVVLVCGSADGMAHGVDAVLRTILGSDVVDDMAAAGRYRRDVY